jgi:hypothetical protein
VIDIYLCPAGALSCLHRSSAASRLPAAPSWPRRAAAVRSFPSKPWPFVAPRSNHHNSADVGKSLVYLSLHLFIHMLHTICPYIIHDIHVALALVYLSIYPDLSIYIYLCRAFVPVYLMLWYCATPRCCWFACVCGSLCVWLAVVCHLLVSRAFEPAGRSYLVRTFGRGFIPPWL